MKRRAIIFLIAGTTFLSALGGVASLLAPVPDSADMEQSIRMEQAETPPVAIAGGSWSGAQSPPPPPPEGDPNSM